MAEHIETGDEGGITDPRHIADLTATLALLRTYRRDEHLQQAIDDFAHAEAYADLLEGDGDTDGLDQ
jgi:hypothetical protein